MRLALAVAVAVLAPGCVRANPAFERGGETGDASGAATSMGTGGTSPTASGSTLLTASASGVTGPSGTLPTATTVPVADISASGPASDSDVMPGDWWDADYAHRVPLVFSMRGEPLFDFVTYVPLTLSASLLEGVSAAQLAFVDFDTGARIPAEVSRVDVAGSVEAWVQLPRWKADGATIVFLYFGASAPDAPSVSPWSEHVAVWHMDEFSNGGTPDAAGSADAAQIGPVRESITEVDGIVGGALEFDGESQRMGAVLSSRPAEDTFLVSGWVNATSFSALGFPMIARGDSVGPSWLQTEWSMGSSGSRMEGRVHDDLSDGTIQPNLGVSLPATQEWHHYAFLYTGAAISFYVDGGMVLSGEAGADLDHTLETVSIGGYSTLVAAGWQGRVLDGRLDEIRWRSGASAEDPNNVWVATLFDSQGDPGTTFTPGEVESL